MPAFLKYNLLALVAVAIGVASLLGRHSDGVILFGLAFLAQAGILGLIGIFRLASGLPHGAYYLLTATLILLIGFGTCIKLL